MHVQRVPFPPAWAREPAHEAARSLAAAHLELLESAARTLTELERLVAKAAPYEPFGSLMRGCANATRDATAVLLSSVRWVLDL